MPLFRDQLNRGIDLHTSPQRIISIVPSQTELLFYLGLDDRIAGITNFCTHPAEKVKAIAKVGGTKKLNITLIKELQPDLIIANKEENERGQIEELMGHFPVWISDINNLHGALNIIGSLGQLLSCTTKAKTLSDTILSRFNKFNIAPLNQRAAYLIWRKPYMAAGTGTFIDSMLQVCGLTNAFELNRYPQVNAAMLVVADPDVVFLSSEPYPFSEKHIMEFKAILPKAKIILVDGEMFSWYGSRLLLAPSYFSSIIDEIKG